jgi:hypothetical protein
MDFHGEHTAFGPAPADEVSQMYLPGAEDHGLAEDDGVPTDDAGHGAGTDPEGSDPRGSDPYAAGTEATSSAGDRIGVNVGGHEMTAPVTIDVDHDGHNDTAIVEDAAGDRIAVTDTDGDGEADHAALLDESGHVLDTAHLDPTGRWVADGPGDRNPYGGTGASVTITTAGSAANGDAQDAGLGAGVAATGTAGGGPGVGDEDHRTTGAATIPAGGAGGPGGSGGIGTSPAGGTGPAGGEPLDVNVGGHTAEVEAIYDVDHDGQDETAVVQGTDGTTIAFSDTDGDGDADRAAVYDADGKLLGTASYHPGTGTWVQDQG